MQMVTRKLKETIVTALIVSIADQKTKEIVFSIPLHPRSEKKLLKLCKEKIEDEQTRLVHIVKTEKMQSLYGVPLETFMQYAQPLDEKRKFKD